MNTKGKFTVFVVTVDWDPDPKQNLKLRYLVMEKVSNLQGIVKIIQSNQKGLQSCFFYARTINVLP